MGKSVIENKIKDRINDYNNTIKVLSVHFNDTHYLNRLIRERNKLKEEENK